MSAKAYRSDLEIAEDATFQRRSWKAERIGWAVLVLIVSAALLGFFGGGGLGKTRVTTPDGHLTLEYDRFWRLQRPTRLSLEVAAGAGSGDRLRIWIGRQYLDAMTVSQIMPQPERVESAADRVVFEFALETAGDPATLHFGIEAKDAFNIRARLGIEGGQELNFNQFIYP